MSVDGRHGTTVDALRWPLSIPGGGKIAHLGKDSAVICEVLQPLKATGQHNATSMQESVTGIEFSVSHCRI